MKVQISQDTENLSEVTTSGANTGVLSLDGSFDTILHFGMVNNQLRQSSLGIVSFCRTNDSVLSLNDSLNISLKFGMVDGKLSEPVNGHIALLLH